MRILLIGAGRVGSSVIGALSRDHALTVLDLDAEGLSALGYRYDVMTVVGNGTSLADLRRAGLEDAQLVIAATDRDEVNIVAGIQARSACAGRIVVRTSSSDYLEAWREGDLPVDIMISAEFETAQAVVRAIGMPGALQTELFAEGRVEMVEFEVHPDAQQPIAGKRIADIPIPDESVVATLIRGETVLIPGGADVVEAGDRIVVIGSPQASHVWAERLARRGVGEVAEVVVAGGGRISRAVSRALARQGLRVRLIERDPERARTCADALPDVEVFHADATDVDFLQRENIGRAGAIVCCTRSDERDLLIALLAKSVGVPTAITVVNDPDYVGVFERVGIDQALNQRLVVAEEIVRYTHDPRTRGFAMLENDRVEVLELAIRPDCRFLDTPFRERPLEGAIVGAIIRGDQVIYPRGDDSLREGDSAIIVAESSRVAELERAL